MDSAPMENNHHYNHYHHHYHHTFLWILSVVQITLGSRMELVNRATLQPVEEGFIQYVPSSGDFVVRDFNRVLPSGSFYWSLPRQYLGNRVSS